MRNWQQHYEGTNSSKPSAYFCSSYGAYFHYASSQQASMQIMKAIYASNKGQDEEKQGCDLPLLETFYYLLQLV
jgi:hypothetical protein